MFAAFTGEEKGLLGSRWFVAHPTLPKEHLAANINLDQLRTIFPLRLLTVHALADTTLGDDARAVAGAMQIEVQPDPEPERNLLRRADQWPFLQAGIPATAFVFGYRPGTESERIYRRWYQTGYHKPQDDLAQRIDWQAAADFNRFFYTFATRIADQSLPPAWKPHSALRPAGFLVLLFSEGAVRATAPAWRVSPSDARRAIWHLASAGSRYNAAAMVSRGSRR